MAITKAPRGIKVTVPRHNAQVIGAKLDSEIKKQESASEWNSLLMTARAERGPQWDIGTQQFLVEEHSELYYDSTPLFDIVNKLTEEEGGGSSREQPAHHHQLQQRPHHPQQAHPPSHHMSQFPMGSPRHQSPMRGGDRDFHPGMGGQHVDSPLRQGHGAPSMQGNFPYPASTPMRGPPGQGVFPGGTPGGGGGGPPFNPMQQQQFFGGNSAPSPMRMGSMGGLTMEDQGMGHPGMGAMGGMGMGGGMQGIPGGPPNMNRRMTRGMTEEGFPMHQ
ncbi:hypothetical protein DFP72DRAFT_371539 [Ephemerocybe angulata]|uniref:Uncharacterized protein n=1 Tax=Ephemerocybe angulata TaxID=980116 RepID=A0A8H6HY35_9AGAR|nr:hypothetical protein DFP72DRAFT_371539 [Tulosesus angulatus]